MWRINSYNTDPIEGISIIIENKCNHTLEFKVNNDLALCIIADESSEALYYALRAGDDTGIITWSLEEFQEKIQILSHWTPRVLTLYLASALYTLLNRGEEEVIFAE